MPKGSYMPKSECHPEKDHYANGLCRTCYVRKRYATNSKFRELAKSRASSYRLNHRDKCNETARKYYHSNKEVQKRKRNEFYKQNRARIRKKIRAKMYGLSVEDYDTMLASQGGVCAICSGGNKTRAFSIDHCHKTNVVRGLLCNNCNAGLGLFKDDVRIIELALQYLKKQQTTQEKIICAKFGLGSTCV